MLTISNNFLQNIKLLNELLNKTKKEICKSHTDLFILGQIH